MHAGANSQPMIEVKPREGGRDVRHALWRNGRAAEPTRYHRYAVCAATGPRGKQTESMSGGTSRIDARPPQEGVGAGAAESAPRCHRGATVCNARPGALNCDSNYRTADASLQL